MNAAQNRGATIIDRAEEEEEEEEGTRVEEEATEGRAEAVSSSFHFAV